MGRKEGGRGLIGCEECVRGEENCIGWYVKNSSETLIDGVRKSEIVDSENSVRKDIFKRERKETLKRNLREKQMYGQFLRDMPDDVDQEKSWIWLLQSGLKASTEALICTAQEQAIRSNSIKYSIDRTTDNPLCRMCGVKVESVRHIISGCEKLAQKEYKRRHDNVARIIHWKLCAKYGFDVSETWYEHKPEGALENDDIKLLWEMSIQCDNAIEARRPDIVVVDKKRKNCLIVDIAIPADVTVGEKEKEKIGKYQDLKREIGRIWNLRCVKVVPVVVGALGCVTKGFDDWIDKLGINTNLPLIQKTALLGTARVLRKVLEY